MEYLEHTVIVLPGILGSELVDDAGRQVWGPGAGRIARSAGFTPSVLSVEESPRLEPVGLLNTITVVPPVLRWPGYDGLIRQIKKTFAGVKQDTARPGWQPKSDTNLLLVPYDFRVGIVPAAEYVHARVTEQLRVKRDRRVIVVGHSMGGLVARYWLGCVPEAPRREALITLGTPHAGAPKALDLLVNGLRLGRKHFRGLTEIARGWQSVYDLLPRYPAVAVSGEVPKYPYELDLPPLVANDRARAAYATHRDIDAGWAERRDRPEVRAVFSRTHSTMRRADLDGDRLSVADSAAGWLPNPSWAGDGTVPADCAIPNDLSDRKAWSAVPERHLPMVASTTLVEILRDYTARPTGGMRGWEDEANCGAAPELGVDLAETYPAGEPLTLTATLSGGAATDPIVHVKAIPREGVGPAPEQRFTRTGDDTWRVTLPDLPPGDYLVRVTATNIPGSENVRCEDVVGVVSL